MNASFHSVPFLHLDNPECQSRNDASHGGQVFPLGLIKDNPHNQTPFTQVILASAELTTPAITLGLCPVCAYSRWDQASLRKGSVLHSPMNYGHVTFRCVSYMKERKMHKNDLQQPFPLDRAQLHI